MVRRVSFCFREPIQHLPRPSWTEFFLIVSDGNGFPITLVHHNLIGAAIEIDEDGETNKTEWPGEYDLQKEYIEVTDFDGYRSFIVSCPQPSGEPLSASLNAQALGGIPDSEFCNLVPAEQKYILSLQQLIDAGNLALTKMTSKLAFEEEFSADSIRKIIEDSSTVDVSDGPLPLELSVPGLDETVLVTLSGYTIKSGWRRIDKSPPSKYSAKN